MKPLLFSLLSLCLLAGCKKEVKPKYQVRICPTKCTTRPYLLSFRGYNSTDLDSVSVTLYKADGSFTEILHDTLYTLQDTDQYHGQGTFYAVGYKSLTVMPGQDYEIQVYKAGQTFRIWDIMECDSVKDQDCSMKDKSFDVDIKSYSFSGGEREITRFYFEPVYFILKK